MAYTFNKDNGFKAGTALPVGGYVCKIVAAPRYEAWDEAQKKYVPSEKFETATRTVVPFDIVEGDYKDFYQKKFDEDESADKKWKGVLILRHPTDQDKYDTNEKRYNSFGAALMDSNSGFTFDINQNQTNVGKLIGIVFREKEFKMENGDIGSYAEPFSTYPVDVIKTGSYKIPHKYVYKDSSNTNSGSASNDFMNIPDGIASEVPF